MARPLRVEYPGAFHHVTGRGIDGQPIFYADEDYAAFLARLAEAHDRWGIVLHAYCLMPNHYHLDLESPEGPFSRPLQWLNQSYTGHLRTTRGKPGRVFDGRFRSVVFEADTYLAELTRYLHLNPVRAGLAKRPEDYRWSSYRTYLGLRQAPAWLDVATTLRQFGRARADRPKRYRAFVREGRGLPDPLQAKKDGSILGSDRFVGWVRSLRTRTKPRATPWDLADLRRRPSLKTICSLVAKAEAVPVERICAKGKKRNDPHNLAMYLARQYAAYSLGDIGRYFGGVSATGVNATVKRVAVRISEDRAFKQRVERLVKKLRAAPKSRV